jgi:hypothetical protein
LTHNIGDPIRSASISSRCGPPAALSRGHLAALHDDEQRSQVTGQRYRVQADAAFYVAVVGLSCSWFG